MYWKINRDKFYKDLYLKHNIEHVNKAGFFFDSSAEPVDLDQSVNWLCTPLHYAKKQLGKSNKPCVLLSTGGFFPIHNGHIDMMKAAKRRVSSHGYQVISAYISPGHDEYISQKEPNMSLPPWERIRKIEHAISHIRWLQVDPWECLFNAEAINFTDVVSRMSQYLLKHLRKNIPVFYVCGGDNSRFAVTFKNVGYCIVVNRPTKNQKIHPEFRKYRNKFINIATERIFWADSYTERSSSEIRNKQPLVIGTADKCHLHLRVDEDVQSFFEFNSSWLLEQLTPSFKNISIRQVSRNRPILNQYQRRSLPTVSLDSCICSEQYLHISRVFDLFGNRMLSIGGSPGHKCLKEQINAVPKDVYIFDYDIYSGKTLKYIHELFKSKGINIQGVFTLKLSDSQNEEVLDARDFFIHPFKSGLVIRLPNGTTARAPYIYPYVCPYARASIQNPVRFSLKVWENNAAFYHSTSTRVREAGEMRNLFLAAGFSDQTLISDVCNWHAELLRKYTGNEKSFPLDRIYNTTNQQINNISGDY